jgi:site-specific recombinase XerC
VKVVPRPGDDITFRQACNEWMDYVAFDRKRRPSTIQDYRREIERRLIPEFGEETPISEIKLAAVEAFRIRMVEEGVLSARTIRPACRTLSRALSRRSKSLAAEAGRSEPWQAARTARQS